jgi:O-acetyl-ADP-ribose deacetylase (regulator of RNase III)
MELQGCPEPAGRAKVTRGYNLPSRFVLHTVGPIVHGQLNDEHERTLAACYRACLDLAVRLRDVRTIAFCAISTGVFGYPKPAAARVALQTVAQWLNEHPKQLDLIVFNVFTDDDYAIYEKSILEPDKPS